MQTEAKCAYCSDFAIGYDEDDALTCGDAATCMRSVKPIGIVEMSSDEDDGDDEDKEVSS
jgi:hypothetical protein